MRGTMMIDSQVSGALRSFRAFFFLPPFLGGLSPSELSWRGVWGETERGGAAGAGDCPGGSPAAPHGGAAAAWGGPSWSLLFWGSLEEWGWRVGVKSSLAGMGPAAGAMLWGAEGCCGVL